MTTGKYRIYCNGELIGTSDLDTLDSDMAIARGQFIPALGYRHVRHVFRLFAEAQRDTGPSDSDMIASYYLARDQLTLTVETSAGVLIPTEVVHIADFQEEIDESACEIEIQLSDSDLLTDS